MHIPDKVPLFGGKKFSLEYFPDLSVEFGSDGTLEVRLDAALDDLYQESWGREKNVEKLMNLFSQRRKDGQIDRRRLPKQYMAGVELELFPYLKIVGRYSEAVCDWALDDSFVGLVAQSKVEQTWQSVLIIPIPPGVIPWYFKVSLSVALETELKVTALTGGAPRFAGALNLSLEVKGSLGAGVDSLFAVEGWVSGAVSESIHFDGGPHIAGADLTLKVGGRAYGWVFVLVEYDFGSLEWNCDVLAGKCSGPGLDAAAILSAAALAESAAPARLIQRAYLGAPGYGGFPAGAAPSAGAARALDVAVGAAAADTQTSAVQQVVFPQSQAFLSAAGDQLQGAWLYDEPTRSAINRSVAVFSALQAVHWNGSAWGAPQTLATFGEGLVRYELAYNGSLGAAVLSLDMDGDSATVDDQELYAINYTGGVWGTLRRLTNDRVVDANPKAAFDRQGALRLVWLRGGSLEDAPLADLTKPRTFYASEYSTNLADFQLAAAADGRRTVVWAEPGEFSSDLKAIFYDPQGDLWGEPRPLTADAETEKYLTAAFPPDGPVVLYNRTPVTQVMQSVRTLSGRTASLAVPQDGLTDLYMTRHTVGSGIAVKAGSLGTFPTNPKPGDPAEIQAVIANTGDTALANVVVRAYLGDPQQGGALIGQTTLTAPLAPWAEQAVKLAWTVPVTEVPLTLFLVVDPDQSLADANRADNAQRLTTVLPDLVASNSRWEWLGSGERLASVVARVVNQGALPGGAGVLRVHTGTATGPVLASLPFGPLAVGQSVDLATTWDVSALPGPTYPLFLAVDEGGAVAEQDESNNLSTLTVGSLADDADKDGMPNAWERDHGFDPLDKGDAARDADGDSLSNLREFQLGTDPRKADTDGDGVSDARDAFPLDPKEQLDTDGDGTGNHADLDDDKDGVPDARDNCPLAANANQVDADRDRVGDACDATPRFCWECLPGRGGWRAIPR